MGQRTERVAAALSRLGLPDDRHARLAVAALMGEGLALSAENALAVRSVAARASKRGPDDALGARLAARALAAGLDTEGASFDRVLGLCSGDPDRDADRGENAGSGGNTGSPEGRGEADRKGDEGAGVPISRVSREIPAEKLASELVKAFPDFVAAALADADLAAFARPGPAGTAWLIVPYSISLDDVDFWGYFRILYNKDSRKTERLVAEIRTGSGSGMSRRVLDLRSGSGGPIVLYRCDDEGERLLVSRDALPGSLTGQIDESDMSELLEYGGYDGQAR